MKTWIRNITLAWLALASSLVMAAAPPELSGMWQGKLAVDAKNSLTIQMTFTKDAKGAYTAVLNSPDNPALKNTPASGVTWDGTTLKLQVPALQGSYTAAMKGGSLEGQWTQPGGNLPLVLAPYSKPVLTKQAASQLIGGWFGKISMAGQTPTVQFRFEDDGKGGLKGTLAIPDMGANGIPLGDIEFANNNLTVRIPQANNGSFTGTLANGVIKGALKVPAPGVPPEGAPLELKKGDYVPPAFPLKLTSEQFAKISGKWTGKLEPPPGPNGQTRTLTMNVTFNTNANGQYVGSIEVPEQRLKVSINEATLADGTLTLKINSVPGGGGYTGKLSGNTVTGNWSQGPSSLPLNLTRTP
ncbi:MAG TPA: hypothetical protein VN762_09285 [Steroidobacteraceae bacterium]|nr:hypothetical protein [Steroidobacteraceae bacterium]